MTEHPKPKQKYQRQFGKNVIAFYGRINGGTLKPLICVGLDGEMNGDPHLGEAWLTTAQARRFARHLIAAAEILEERKADD